MRKEWLIVDNFAGGGGASEGIRLAVGRAPDIAVNHNKDAITMHEANHPETLHLCEDVWRVDPVKATRGRPVWIAWFSPDCTHFSRAKGSKPVKKKIRGLAWVVVKWVKAVRPRVIFVENVREFQDWGPLIIATGSDGKTLFDKDGSPLMVPDPTRRGLTFRRWVGHLRNEGYTVEWRELDAADYGAPTHRKRLFLIARCDGESTTWPDATHGREGSGLIPFRTAAECIDWSIPCPSIFERKRPLKENTLKRIARGLKRFVIDAKEPFIVTCNHGDETFRGQSVNEPMRTITAARDAHGVVMPYIARIGQNGGNGDYCSDTRKPLTTVTSKNEHLLITPYIAGVGGRQAQVPPRSVASTMSTITAKNDKVLVAPTLIQTGYGERKGQAPRAPGLDKPLGTVVAGGAKHALVSAFIAKHFGGVTGVPIERPLPTTTARGTQNQVVAATFISNQNRIDRGTSVLEPLNTICSNNHAAEVRAFLIKYYGSGSNGCDLRAPLDTITSHDRFGIVTIRGEEYQIVDIGMRMLSPRELARAQGFEDSYKLTGTKTKQVERIGNSVCPVMAQVLVRANCATFLKKRRAA